MFGPFIPFRLLTLFSLFSASLLGLPGTEPFARADSTAPGWAWAEGFHRSGLTKDEVSLRAPLAGVLPSELVFVIKQNDLRLNGRTTYGLRLLDEAGNGVEVRFKIQSTRVWIRRVEGGKTISSPLEMQNTVRLLLEPTYHEEFKVKVALDQKRARLYLDFYDQDLFYIQGEAEMSGAVPTIVEYFAESADVSISSPVVTRLAAGLPPLNLKRPVGDRMPTWLGYVGTHYAFRAHLINYRDPNFIPSADWFDAHHGKSVFDLTRAYAREREDWQEPDLPANIDRQARNHVDKACTYLLRAYEEWKVAPQGVFFQLGNEINRYKVINNQPYLSQRYTDLVFEPLLAGVRRAEKQGGLAPGSIPLLYGSIARGAAPDAMAWLNATLNREMTGDIDRSLAGRKAIDFVKYLSVQYMEKGPFSMEYMERLYETYIESGKMQGIWSTEELGGGDAARISGTKVLGVASRYLDWWSRHDWQENRGMLYFWGDWWGADGYPSAFLVEDALADFLQDFELQNLTDQVTLDASADAEVYVFAKKHSAEGHYMATLMSNRYLWLDPVRGQCDFRSLTIPVPPTQSGNNFRVVLKRVVPSSMEVVFDRRIVAENGALHIPIETSLDLAQWESLVVFASAEAGDFGKALESQALVPEPNRKIDGGEIVSFQYGNYLWGSPRGLDDGMEGDTHALAASNYNDFRVSYKLNLLGDYPADQKIEILPDLPTHSEGKSLQLTTDLSVKAKQQDYRLINIYWDGWLVLKNIPQGQIVYVVKPDDRISFAKGEHTLTLTMTDEKNTKFRPQLDALRIRTWSGNMGAAPEIAINGERLPPPKQKKKEVSE